MKPHFGDIKIYDIIPKKNISLPPQNRKSIEVFLISSLIQS